MVLVFIDQSEGTIKKSSFEAAAYGVAVAQQTGTTAEAIVLGETPSDAAQLGNYGINTVHVVEQASLKTMDAQAYAKVLQEAADKLNAGIIIFSNNTTAKAVAPRLSARMKAGLVSGAIALPETANGFTVKKSVFSGKAFAHVNILTDKKIIALNPNAFAVTTTTGNATVQPLEVDAAQPAVTVTNVNKVVGEVPLSEASVVVSGGRGLKGPENWGFVTELAGLLGAATACSRPVADIHWRPHHEHVGQTGLAIAPNLYIAIGISGAIQHLAGVNRSKTIVVINKDPEAPFFKAADYGIVGDLFEVMPKIIAEVKRIKGVA
jgi:electron transfer flavoprotein alpha subunit